VKDTDAEHYTVPAGRLKYAKRWSLPLRCTAKLNFLLPLIEPLDPWAWTVLCRAWCPYARGERIPSWAFLLFYAHAVKWPPCQQRWLAQWGPAVTGPVTGRRMGPVTGRRIVEELLALALWSDAKAAGADWQDMHNGMGVGTTAVNTGLVATLRELGMVRSIKPDEAAPEDATILTLGRGGIRYVVKDIVDCEAAMANCADAVTFSAATDVSWPAADDTSLRRFANGLLALATRIRSHRSQAGGDAKPVGLHGGISKEHEYQCKHFVRYFLKTAEEMDPGGCQPSIDRLTMRNLAVWLPDENQHIEPINDLTGAAARRLFGITPLMISCWACFLHACTEEYLRRILKAQESELWPRVLAWQTERAHWPDDWNAYDWSAWPPTPAELLPVLQGSFKKRPRSAQKPVLRARRRLAAARTVL